MTSRSRNLALPTTLTFVAVTLAAVTPWACGGDSPSSEFEICLPDADAGPDQKCPDSASKAGVCPPGCEAVVV